MNKDKLIFPYEPYLKQYARQNRVAGNPSEIKLWTQILSVRELVHYKWTRQKPIASYIVDFYCSKLKLAIEIDGESHTEKEEYDLKRDKYLSDFGIEVIHFLHHDVLDNIGGIYEVLMLKVQEREKLLGRERGYY